MSILSVDNISPIGSGTSVTVNSAATLVLTNANSTGVVTATTFSGSGASLTNLPAANLTGTLPAISGANLTSLPAQATIANNADNRVITGGSGVNLNGEANLTFNGNTLSVTGTTNLYGNGGASAVWGNTGYTGHLTYDGSDNAIIRAASGKALIFQTNHTNERLRIGSSGQIGIAGANYGTAGQVLTSQGSGSVVQWATPAVTGGNMFIAKMNSGYITSNNTDGEIVFQNEVYDPDSRYNNSNGRFTPNVAGYYFIDASLQFSTNSANNNFESTIWKNGTEQFKNRMRNPASNSDIHCKVSGIVSVNGSSDYISIAAWQNSGGNITINPGNGSYFMGYFLRSL